MHALSTEAGSSLTSGRRWKLWRRLLRHPPRAYFIHCSPLTVHRFINVFLTVCSLLADLTPFSLPSSEAILECNVPRAQRSSYSEAYVHRSLQQNTISCIYIVYRYQILCFSIDIEYNLYDNCTVGNVNLGLIEVIWS